MQRNARAEKAAQKTGGREATGISEWCMKTVETSNGNEVKQAHKEAEMRTMESTPRMWAAGGRHSSLWGHRST